MEVAKDGGLSKDLIESKICYKSRIEQEKMKEVENMAMHSQFHRDTKTLNVSIHGIFLVKRFEKGNRKPHMCSTGTSSEYKHH